MKQPARSKNVLRSIGIDRYEYLAFNPVRPPDPGYDQVFRRLSSRDAHHVTPADCGTNPPTPEPSLSRKRARSAPRKRARLSRPSMEPSSPRKRTLPSWPIME